MVLTHRGRAAAVLVDPALFDELEEAREVVTKVMRGLADGVAGRTVSSSDLFDELEAVIRRAEATDEG